jgi:hypothetical protein
MPPRTGGRAATATRAREEVYVMISGRVTFKAGDDVFEAGPQTAVRRPARSSTRSTTTATPRPNC